MSDHGYRDSKLKEYVGMKLPVTAIYEGSFLDQESDIDSEYVLLADIRSIGGDLLRNHIWSPEVEVFKVIHHLEKGSVVRFDGFVSEYSKGINSKTIDYTLINIADIKIVGNRLSSREVCNSSDYKKHTEELESKIVDLRKKLSEKGDKDLSKKRENSELRKENAKLLEKYKDLSKTKQSLTMKNRHLRKLIEIIYNISKSRTVKKIEPLKKRIQGILENAINRMQEDDK